MIFDSKLTWVEHIATLCAKSSKRINLLKYLTRIPWCNDTYSLISFFKNYIRSVLDFGSILYSDASVTNLKKLDSIQYKCLSLCLGTLPRTSLPTLQVLARDAPLSIRREQLMLNYALSNAVAGKNCLKLLYEKTKLFSIVKVSQPSLLVKCNDIVKEFGSSVEFHEDSRSLLDMSFIAQDYLCCSIDLSVQDLVKSSVVNPFDLNLEISHFLNFKYPNYIRIYTDASVIKDRGAMAAFIVPELNLSGSMKLNKYTPPVYAELMAIILAISALEVVVPKNYLILTDCLRALDILNMKFNSLYLNVKKKFVTILRQASSSNFVFSWIPAGCIQGNIDVDSLVRELNSNFVSRSLLPNKILNLPIIDKCQAVELCLKYQVVKWNSVWATQLKGREYYKLCSDVNFEWKYKPRLRYQQIMLYRLMSGKCEVRSYLYLLNKVTNTKCSFCEEIETVEHLFVNCKNSYSPAHKLRELCANHNYSANSLRALLNREETARYMIDFMYLRHKLYKNTTNQ